jgi:hypothetical protein
MNIYRSSHFASRLVGTLLCNLTQVEPVPGAQARALSFTAHCYACWWAGTFFPNVWTIWQLTFFPLSRLFFYELGLNLFLDDLLFAKWAPPADSGFDGVWAAIVSADEPVVAAFQPAASFLR